MSRLRFCLDCRRLGHGGIGRLTAELAYALEDSKLGDLRCLTPRSRIGDLSASQLKRLVHFNPPQFSADEFRLLPQVLRDADIDIFITPQYHTACTLSCRVVSWVHDVWPLWNPEWLPQVSDVTAKYGNQAREAVAIVIETYRTGRCNGTVFPNNDFLAQFDRSDNPRLQTAAVAALAITIARSARIVTCSQASFTDIVSYFPECHNRLRVVYNPLPQCFASLDTSQANLPVRDNVVLHVGKWEPRKNVPALIQAFAELAPDYPLLRLCLVGPGGSSEERAPVYNCINAFGLQDRVSILTDIQDSDLLTLYRSSRMFVLPSLHEGFSIPILEALHCGTPVVATCRGAIQEIFGNCFQPFNPHAAGSLAHAMRSVLTDSDKCERLVANGRQRVSELQRFDFRQAVEKVIAEAASS